MALFASGLTKRCRGMYLVCPRTGYALAGSSGLRMQERSIKTMGQTHSLNTVEQTRQADLGESLSRGGFKSDNPEQTYDLWAKQYVDDVENIGFHSPGTCALYAGSYWPSRRQNEVTEVKVADIGCGTGLVAQLIENVLTEREKENATFVGLDLSEEMIKEAQKTGMYRTICKGSASAVWPFEPNSVHMAVCNGVLIYCSPSRATCEEFIRIIKPGGHAVIMLRMDQVSEWKPFIDMLELEGAWTLVEQSPVHNNFSNPSALDEPVFYSQFIFRIEPGSYSN